MIKRFRFALAVVLAVAMLGVLPAAAQLADDDAAEVIAKAAAFVGGADALADLEGFSVEATGLRWVLDEGFEVGDGATGQGTFDAAMTYSVADDALKIDYSISAFGFDRVVSEIVDGDLGYIDGQNFNGAPAGVIPMLSDRLVSIRQHQRLLNPHLILIDALADPDIVTHVKEKANGDHVVRIADGQTPLRVLIDGGTGRIKKVATGESDPLRRDVRLKVFYGQWQDVGGISFPSLVTVRYDGELIHAELRHNVTVNPVIDPAMFEIPAGVDPVFDAALALRGDLSHQYLQSFAALGFTRDGFQPNVEGTELAAGVWWITGGSHHSLAVVQDDAVIVVEGALDEVRTDAVLDWLEANVAKPVSHVVQSHHHADHSAGLRQYAAAGADVVVHEAAAGFFEQVMDAKSNILPDGLSAPGAPAATVVGVPGDQVATVFGADVPVSVYPFSTPHAEDYVLIEAGGILFVVDIFSPGFGPPPPELDVIVQFVIDNEIEIDWIAGGHGGIVAWEELVGTS